MSARTLDFSVYAVLIAFALAAPFVFPNYTSQVAVMWLMVLMAVTWDMTGGQMGYNSLGNVIFFGLGMYASAVVQIWLVYDVAEYTSAFGAIVVDFNDTLVTLITICMVVGSILLAPAIVLGYAVKAAEKDDVAQGL